MIEKFLSPELVDALGWTLLHSLWQGAGYALILGVLLVLMRKYSPQARHFMAAGLLGAFVLTAVFTFGRLYLQPEYSRPEIASPAADVSTTVHPPDYDAGSPLPSPVEMVEDTEARATVTAMSFADRAEAYFDRHLPLIVTIWLMGILILLLRFLGQLAYLQRLKSYGTRLLPPDWEERIRELEERLNVSRKVTYLLSYRSSSPFTVGWLRPFVILPEKLFSSLTDSQIYNILAHELAHISRNDYLINLLQQLATIVFFYHPGAWWMSSRIAEEREHCCDDLAIDITGKRKSYAETLIHLQTMNMKTYNLSLPYAGNAGGFRGRIYRLFATGFSGASFREGVLTTGVLFVCLALGLTLTQLSNNPTTELLPDAPVNSEEIPDFFPTIVDTNDPELKALIEAIIAGKREKVSELIKNEDLLEAEDRNGFTPLMWAAWGDQVEIAQDLLKAGADVNHTNKYGWTALIEAADEDAVNTLKLLLDAGAYINSRSDQWNKSALSMAASENHREIFDILVEAGARLEGSSALHVAAEEGNLDILMHMVENLGADINERDERGRTPISYAAEEDEDGIVIYLMKAGADLSIADDRGKMPIDYAVEEDASTIISVFTKDRSAELPPLREDMLFEASKNGNVDLLVQLIDEGFNVNTLNQYQRTPLMEAVRESEVAAASLLLESGAKVNLQDENNHTAMTMAVREGDPAMMRMLIDAGADLKHTTSIKHVAINTVDKKASQAQMVVHENAGLLFLAVNEEEDKSITLLIDESADPNVGHRVKIYDVTRDLTNNDGSVDLDQLDGLLQEDAPHMQLKTTIEGWTPLMQAARSGEDELVELLLQKGANPGQKNSLGETASEVAKSAGHIALAKVLK
ncbi:ankyrin repeat domain-containing protein [Lewinella sp. W8]|uniref:ankyrin repeat domain-containing protein n=1 Tax=Lewinella sp. W8 TaxID=2528208 RepID=UPI001068CB76|nr:ankyrin repeat domain-containing protein [Lewinella sp. W8]MTB53549.1 M48 family metalloprotease [Lewinella sp. W8]